MEDDRLAERGEVYRQQCEWRMTAWAERGEVYRQQRERVSEVFFSSFYLPHFSASGIFTIFKATASTSNP